MGKGLAAKAFHISGLLLLLFASCSSDAGGMSPELDEAESGIAHSLYAETLVRLHEFVGREEDSVSPRAMAVAY